MIRLASRRSHRTYPAQSLVEFAILLPAVLILIMLIVRVMTILSLWYSVLSATHIGVRAVTLTGLPAEGCRIILENLPGFDVSRLQIRLTFGTQDVICQLVSEPVPGLRATQIGITLTPAVTKFLPPVTPSATPQTPVPGKTLPPTPTADPLALLNYNSIPDLPVRIQVDYDTQIVGPMAPDWTIRLTARSVARLETRLTPIPTPKRDFF
jgi:hypothetical protein